jgi:uncharacterized protein YndB with AHSA1/START domain
LTDRVTEQEITITRVFDAPRELVWKAWTEPEQLARWWGPAGWTNPLETISMDVRPGGRFSVTSISDTDGTEMTSEGVYREVFEMERLVFDEPAENAWHEGAVSTATFTDMGDGRTEVVLHSTINTTDEMRAGAEAGMAGSLDRLAEHLAAR